ncbi:MAG: DUF4234 domain-containing protein [Bdellovibrionales bacterium]
MDKNTNLPRFEEVEKNIVLCVFLSFITFGIYNLFWQAHQIRVWNQLLGYPKYGFWKWFFLSLFTFGLYHIYHEYIMGDDMVKIQKKFGHEPNNLLPVLSVGLAVMALPIIADAIQQYELHKLYEGQLDHSRMGRVSANV